MVRAGWDNVVLDVNNGLIFRFPRFKGAQEKLKREIRLLSILHERLPVPIPHYEYVAPSFGGYRKIVGRPTSRGSYRRAWNHNLARDLANFQRELHTTKIGRLMSGIFPVWDQKRRIRKIRTEARAKGYKFLDAETRRLSEVFFQKGLATFDNVEYDPAFVHGDLTDNNILIDPKTGKLAGVLDWNDSAIMDPAIDFAGLFELNRKLGYATLAAYGDDSSDFRARVEVYWRLLPYFEILYGIDSNIPQLRDIGAKRLRKRLKAPGLL